MENTLLVNSRIDELLPFSRPSEAVNAQDNING
jgi:hypothetical protein